MDNRRNAVLRVLLCTTRVQPSSSVRLTGWPGGQVADLRQLVDQVQVANAPLYFAEAEQRIHSERIYSAPYVSPGGPWRARRQLHRTILVCVRFKEL